MREFKIGNFWTYGDFHALIQNGWSLDPAEPKTNYVDIPGGDGSLDLSEAVAGHVTYKDRGFNATLILPPMARKNWETYRRNLTNAIHGFVLDLTLPDDQEHYLRGRFSVGAYDDSDIWATVAITAVCEPWRFKNKLTTRTFKVTGTQTVELSNERRLAVPKVTTNASITLTYQGTQTTLAAGTYSLISLMLDSGNNIIKIDGSATVTFEYQEASL